MALDLDTTTPVSLAEVIHIGELCENASVVQRAKAALALLVSRTGLGRDQILALPATEVWEAAGRLIEDLGVRAKLSEMDCGSKH